jgi:CHAD domain-containing protein
MASTLRTRPKRAGLKDWMDCAFERVAAVRPDFEADAVHDLRVALRRCRTMADALREVTPDSSWRKIKKLSRDLFHTLGALRDVQVQRDWVKKVGSPQDPFRRALLRRLRAQETTLREKAFRAVDNFDSKQWRKLSQRLESKSTFFPPESVVYQRLAVKQLNEAIALYGKARKARASLAWHRLRIELKKFRYVVENFLPLRYEAWSADLKSAQDVLGDIHDLDVVRQAARCLSKESERLNDQDIANRVSELRKERVAAVIANLSGAYSPLDKWSSGFQQGQPLVAASFPVVQRRTA